MNALRKGLPERPARMRNLPIDDRGYVIPWFVKWIDGKPDFRVIDREKFIKSVQHGLCHVCGTKLGRYKSFVGGPMAVLQLISGEPPVHRECALFAAKACPFLLLPKSKRRSANLPEDIGPIGAPTDHFVEENPGITCVYTCTKFHIDKAGSVFKFDDCESLEWFTEGREATQEEINAALIGAKERLSKLLSPVDHVELEIT